MKPTNKSTEKSYLLIKICDPSDQNESHVNKLHFWEYIKIWSKVIFAHFQILLEMGAEIRP